MFPDYIRDSVSRETDSSTNNAYEDGARKVAISIHDERYLAGAILAEQCLASMPDEIRSQLPFSLKPIVPYLADHEKWVENAQNHINLLKALLNDELPKQYNSQIVFDRHHLTPELIDQYKKEIQCYDINGYRGVFFPALVGATPFMSQEFVNERDSNTGPKSDTKTNSDLCNILYATSYFYLATNKKGQKYLVEYEQSEIDDSYKISFIKYESSVNGFKFFYSRVYQDLVHCSVDKDGKVQWMVQKNGIIHNDQLYRVNLSHDGSRYTLESSWIEKKDDFYEEMCQYTISLDKACGSSEYCLKYTPDTEGECTLIATVNLDTNLSDGSGIKIAEVITDPMKYAKLHPSIVPFVIDMSDYSSINGIYNGEMFEVIRQDYDPNSGVCLLLCSTSIKQFTLKYNREDDSICI